MRVLREQPFPGRVGETPNATRNLNRRARRQQRGPDPRPFVSFVCFCRDSPRGKRTFSVLQAERGARHLWSDRASASPAARRLASGTRPLRTWRSSHRSVKGWEFEVGSLEFSRAGTGVYSARRGASQMGRRVGRLPYPGRCGVRLRRSNLVIGPRFTSGLGCQFYARTCTELTPFIVAGSSSYSMKWGPHFCANTARKTRPNQPRGAPRTPTS
jgi:hypothetical protein